MIGDKPSQYHPQLPQMGGENHAKIVGLLFDLPIFTTLPYTSWCKWEY